MMRGMAKILQAVAVVAGARVVQRTANAVQHDAASSNELYARSAHVASSSSSGPLFSDGLQMAHALRLKRVLLATSGSMSVPTVQEPGADKKSSKAWRVAKTMFKITAGAVAAAAAVGGLLVTGLVGYDLATGGDLIQCGSACPHAELACCSPGVSG